MASYKDIEVICYCGSIFKYTAKDQEYYELRGFKPPRRCKPCRAAKKAADLAAAVNTQTTKEEEQFDSMFDSKPNKFETRDHQRQYQRERGDFNL